MALLFFGGFAFFCGSVLHIIARNREREAKILKSVTRVNLLNDLAYQLDAERLPSVVRICGQVASENPINCEITGLKGVIVEKRVEKPYLWTLYSRLISCNAEEVPWYLDDGTDHVHVAGARGATDFLYPAARSKFDESGQTLVRDDTLGSLQDKTILGLKRTERVLPIGTHLTVIGEATKGDDGRMQIQRPRKGPFYVSSKTSGELIANIENSSRWWKYISVGLMAIGSLIAAYAIKSRG